MQHSEDQTKVGAHHTESTAIAEMGIGPPSRSHQQENADWLSRRKSKTRHSPLSMYPLNALPSVTPQCSAHN